MEILFGILGLFCIYIAIGWLHTISLQNEYCMGLIDNSAENLKNIYVCSNMSIEEIKKKLLIVITISVIFGWPKMLYNSIKSKIG